MHLCPHCGVVLMEGLRFCLQCGSPLPATVPDAPGITEEGLPAELPLAEPVVEAPPLPPPPDVGSEPGALDGSVPVESPASSLVAPVPPPVSLPCPTDVFPDSHTGLEESLEVPRAVFSPDATVALKISPSPMIAPREGVPLERTRSKLGRDMLDIDEDVLSRSFRRPDAAPDTIFCRFCKAPLALEVDFCETCGAPVADAAPPGTLKSEEPTETASNTPSTPSATSSIAFSSAPAASASPAVSTTDTAQVPPDAPASAQESQAGLADRLRGLFKKA